MAGVSPQRSPFSSPWRALGLIALCWLGLCCGSPAWAEDPPLAPVNGSPALLLANSYHPGIDLGRYWVSEKLDGVRARWDGARLISRGGRPIQAPAWFLEGFPTTPLDGELWFGRDSFDQLSAIVRRQAPNDAEWRRVRYMIFELPNAPGSFTHRVEQIKVVTAATMPPVGA